MKYEFISSHKKVWPVSLMCDVFQVKRGGYYHYEKISKEPNPEHEAMIMWVKELAKASDYSYGSRRMREALNALGYPVGRDKTRNLMKEANVKARYRKKYKVTTNSNHKHPVFDNLLERNFAVTEINTVFASDITYVWTQEGWLYLAVVIDLCSRKVVGWSMSSRMRAQIVCDALTMAVWQRRPPSGLVHHSDRGSQYASKAFKKLLKAHGFKGSMSRKGDCWDNAVVESFFGRLKQERVQWKHYQTRQEAQQDILDYITMFYNSTRLHSYLGYKSPNQFENEMMEDVKNAA